MAQVHEAYTRATTMHDCLGIQESYEYTQAITIFRT